MQPIPLYSFCHCPRQAKAEFPVGMESVILESKHLGDLHANVVTALLTFCPIFNIPEVKSNPVYACTRETSLV